MLNQITYMKWLNEENTWMKYVCAWMNGSQIRIKWLWESRWLPSIFRSSNGAHHLDTVRIRRMNNNNNYIHNNNKRQTSEIKKLDRSHYELREHINYPLLKYLYRLMDGWMDGLLDVWMDHNDTYHSSIP